MRVHQHRPIQGRVKTVSVKREGDRWFVVLSCDDVPTEPLPETGSAVGLDMGVEHFATTSDGEHLPNPRHGQALADELAQAQRHLATFGKRKQARDRTKPHREAARKVAKLHRKVQRQRRDHHRTTALALVREHDTIAVENLNIAGMTRSPEPKPDPDQTGAYLPNQAAAKAGLNNSILDAGWGSSSESWRTKLKRLVAAWSRWMPATPPAPAPTVGTWTARTASPKPASCVCAVDAARTRTWLAVGGVTEEECR